MTNLPAEAGAAPASKGLLARAIGIITAPTETFRDVVAAPRWFGMLALTTLIIALLTSLPLTTDAGRQAAIDQQVTQMKSFGVEVTDQMYDQMQKGAGRLPYITGISVVVVSPIIVLIVTGIFFAIFNAAMGGEASFRQVLAVVIHAGVISALSALFSGGINFFRGTSERSVANLGILLQMLPEQSFLVRFAGMIDVFLIWYCVVLAIGLAVLYRRRTQPIAIALLALYAVIAIVVALIKSRVGSA